MLFFILTTSIFCFLAVRVAEFQVGDQVRLADASRVKTAYDKLGFRWESDTTVKTAKGTVTQKGNQIAVSSWPFFVNSPVQSNLERVVSCT